VITAGGSSEELIGLDIRGKVFTGFDTRLVLLRSTKTVSVVMLCEVDMGMFVKSCVMPDSFAVNPAGKEAVSNKDPFEEWIFMIALIFCPTSIGSDTE